MQILEAEKNRGWFMKADERRLIIKADVMRLIMRADERR
jgi:hypothetical protein